MGQLGFISPSVLAIGVSDLGERERQILSCVGSCLTSPEIAAKLGISVHTVRAHRLAIMRKARFKHESQLVKLAIFLGLASADPFSGGN